MRIGSTSKQFTALAIMLLAEEGRLSIDDSPRVVLPELPGWARGVTLRQMMAHTSGMRDSLDLLLHAAGPGVAAAPDIHLRTLAALDRSEEHTSELQSLMRISYAVFCLKKKNIQKT